jgi:hypothetical protein
MGREDELNLPGYGELSVEDMGARITALPLVRHGRCQEMVDALDIKALTGSDMGIKFIDLESYEGLGFFGSRQGGAGRGREGGIFVNIHKTIRTDPDHVYLAVSKNIDDASLVHQLAHVLDYLGGSRLMPGTSEPLAFELDIPVEHLDHTEEFGSWLFYLAEKFHVTLDADDAIIAYLYEKGLLLRGSEIRGQNGFILKSKSDRILRFLKEHQSEVDALIRTRPGYIGPPAGKKPGDSL